MGEILSIQIFSNTLAAYSLAALVFVVSFFLLWLLKLKVISRIYKLSEATDNEVDDLLVKVVGGVGGLAFTLVSLTIAVRFLEIPGFFDRTLSFLILLFAVYYGVRALQQVVDFAFDAYAERRLEEGTRFDPSVLRLLSKFLKISLWFLAALLLVQNLGYDVTALVAGLGIGGIAVALALQNVLSDVFASFSIYFDRPFETGDFIIVGNDMGTVKHIGIKSTRLEALQGQEIVISNRELTSVRVNNYKKMEKRRIVFSFGLTYETPSEKLRKIPSIVRDIVERQESAEFDRAHFASFGDSALNFEVVYYMTSPEYTVYMDTQQALNLELKERLESEGMEFAYPTRTVFVKRS